MLLSHRISHGDLSEERRRKLRKRCGTDHRAGSCAVVQEAEIPLPPVTGSARVDSQIAQVAPALFVVRTCQTEDAGGGRNVAACASSQYRVATHTAFLRHLLLALRATVVHLARRRAWGLNCHSASTGLRHPALSSCRLHVCARGVVKFLHRNAPYVGFCSSGAWFYPWTCTDL